MGKFDWKERFEIRSAADNYLVALLFVAYAGGNPSGLHMRYDRVPMELDPVFFAEPLGQYLACVARVHADFRWAEQASKQVLGIRCWSSCERLLFG